MPLKPLIASLKVTGTFILIVLISITCSRTNQWFFKEGGSLLWIKNKRDQGAIKSAVKGVLENSSIIVAQIPWSPYDNSFFQTCAWYFALARDHGKSFMIAVDWQNIERSGTAGDWSFTNEETSKLFKRDMLKLSKAYNPDYINLGVEVNYYALTSPNGYRSFASVYRELKIELEQENPKLKVGLSYQLELLYGHHEGWDKTKTLQTLNNLLGDLDYLGVSTYPNVILEENQSQLWSSLYYLDSISKSYSLPVGISETAASSKLYDMKERGNYVRAVFQKATDLNLKFVIWGSMIDSDKDDVWSDKIGLLNSYGQPKEEFYHWREANNNFYK